MKKTSIAKIIVTVLALGSGLTAKAALNLTATVGGIPSVSGATLLNFNGATPSVLTLNAGSSLTTGANYSVEIGRAHV